MLPAGELRLALTPSGTCRFARGPAARPDIPHMSAPEPEPAQPDSTTGPLEKEEAKLWRLALLFVVLLATALAGVSWERLQSLPYHLGSLLPTAVICVAVAFFGLQLRAKETGF